MVDGGWLSPMMYSKSRGLEKIEVGHEDPNLQFSKCNLIRCNSIRVTKRQIFLLPRSALRYGCE